MTTKKTAKRPTFEGPAIFDIPFPEPTLTNIYVRPKPPRKTLGSGILEAALRTQEAQLAVATMGQIVAASDLAFRVNTPDMDVSKCPAFRALAFEPVGQWVVFRQGIGQKLHIRALGETDLTETDEAADRYILIMSDTDILGRFKSEADAARFRDWV